MSLGSVLLVGGGGALGAAARHLVGLWIRGRTSIVAVNVLGSFVFGGVLAAPVTPNAVLIAGVGFCGAFTTFSSFALETVTTAEGGERGAAVRFALYNLVGAVVALGAGSFLVAAATGGGIP